MIFIFSLIFLSWKFPFLARSKILIFLIKKYFFLHNAFIELQTTDEMKIEVNKFC